ncbi:MAG: cysteine desulfurase [Candidatus Nezhaarchaeota archaeon]|nr:cysteine desulfurase [Candidatus Nezhaarchaeota archaeon]
MRRKMTGYDVHEVRKDFPLLSKGLIYFDNAATSLTPRKVVDAMVNYLLECRANVGRGSYPLARIATEMYEDVREKAAKFIGAKPKEVAFVKNTTEAINLVSAGIKWRKEDNVVITALEHHSNMLPWLRSSKLHGFELRTVKPNRDGLLMVEDLEKAVDNNTRVISVAHVSNVLGTITPLKDIAEVACSHGALLFVDAAQSAPHMPIDLRSFKCDFLAFSAHKMCGPPGVGVLYINEGVEVEPLNVGGGTVSDASLSGYRLVGRPAVFEAGTPPISDVIGLGAAIDYLTSIGLENIARHEVELARKIRKSISALPFIKVLGPEDPQTGIISFSVEGVKAEDVALAMGNLNICVRAGFHCAIPLVRDILGEGLGVVRASLYLYNTAEEVDVFLEALENVVRTLKGVS